MFNNIYIYIFFYVCLMFLLFCQGFCKITWQQWPAVLLTPSPAPYNARLENLSLIISPQNTPQTLHKLLTRTKKLINAGPSQYFGNLFSSFFALPTLGRPNWLIGTNLFGHTPTLSCIFMAWLPYFDLLLFPRTDICSTRVPGKEVNIGNYSGCVHSIPSPLGPAGADTRTLRLIDSNGQKAGLSKI